MLKEYIEPNKFKSFLDTQTGERGISDFLKNRPQILYWTLCRAGGHCRFMFREFPIGTAKVADYVIVNSYSGAWEVMFIELEPVDDQVFTKAGKPNKRLAQALKQVDDWVEYYDLNKQQIRSDLVRLSRNKDILDYDSFEEPMNLSGDYLSDPYSYIKDSYHIIIGRRNELRREDHKRKSTYSIRHQIEIMSYDRLVDVVRARYSNTEYWLDNVR